MIYRILFVAAFILLGIGQPISRIHAQEADWRTQIGTFRIGLVGSRVKGDASRKLRPFQKLLQKELGMPVEFFFTRDFTTLIQAQVSSRIEYAIYSSTAFATAWSLCKCVEPLVSPMAEDGSRGFRSVLISRQSDRLKLTSLRDKRVLLGGSDSFASNQFPRGILKKEGIDFKTSGWNFVTAKSPENALNRFVNGDVDALFGWEPSQGPPEKQVTSGTLARLKIFRSKQVGGLSVLWRSPLVPYGVHSVRSALSSEAKALLLGVLLTLKEQNPVIYNVLEPDYSGGFTQAEAEDFTSVVDFIGQIGDEAQ